MRLDDVPTPALLLDRRVLERNLVRMAQRARDLGVCLRPHVKTHKCVEVAALQRQHGARGLTVSTLPEAIAFADAGFDDLTWAFPLSPPKIPAALELARRITLRLVLDDQATLEALQDAAAAAGQQVHAWLKVDCGYHRAGVDPSTPEAVELARLLASSMPVLFDGLLTHAGHSYHATDRRQRLGISAQERDAVVDFAARLRREGVPVPEVSVGSTPTMTVVENLEGVDEARPGNYAFFDLTQVALGSCEVEDVAVSVLTTVVSHPPGPERAVVDAGALALSKDVGHSRAASDATMGAVCPGPDGAADDSLMLQDLSQEHGIIRPAHPGGLAGRLPVGARLRILPNHSCLTTACHDTLHVVDGGRVVDKWKIHRGR